MIPYGLTVTSHMSITFAIAMMILLLGEALRVGILNGRQRVVVQGGLTRD